MADPLLVRSPDRTGDAAAVMDLVAKSFGTYARIHAECEQWYVLHSRYDWDASAVGVLGGALVSHWGVWPYWMRVGRARVRCGGIGGVATAAALRGKGLMARTAPHSLERMRRGGYHLSILFGIDRFYGRFGYVAAWPESRWYLARVDLPPALPPLAGLRRIPAAMTPALVRQHARWCRGLTGTAIRPTYRRWSGMKPGEEAHAWGPPGHPEGHLLVRVDGDTLVCLEGTGEPDEVLAALARLSRRRVLPRLRFDALPHRSALAARLRRLNVRNELEYTAEGEAMIRVIDLAGCLAAMAPELEARLAASELHDYRGRLAVRGPEGAAGLRLAAGRVEVGPLRPARSAVRGGWALARLLIGSDEPEEVCEAGGIRLTGDAARLVRVLFPAQHPQLQLADRF